jgi:8-oxo-dGTP pyrophosphatase MutT (NUDIX family)
LNKAGKANGIDVSCGTLVVDGAGRLLLCHVTGTGKWDIPKGLLDPGEDTLAAAMRELDEEAGLVFGAERFIELGRFTYRRDKCLHLYKVEVGEAMPDLGHLRCRSFFPHHITGKPTPETDGFRWATRDEVAKLCWPRMAERLLGLAW